MSKFTNAVRGVLGLVLGFGSTAAMAGIPLNMPEGSTTMSKDIYDLHMHVFYVCVGIGVVVFSMMIYSIFKHRKSKGSKPAQFHDSTAIEITWTIIPFLILIGMAIPAAKVLVRFKNETKPAMTVKVTGYQWKWHYEYMDNGIGFFSTLANDSNVARQLHSGINPDTVKHYLRDVDHPLVLPIHKKVRILLTSGDVIHSWWVPDFGGKTDAIPGFINEEWVNITKPGVYRGACAELCGRGHAFMPIVVVALKDADYKAWIKKTEAAHGVYINPHTGQPEQAGSPVTFDPAVFKQESGGSGMKSTVANEKDISGHKTADVSRPGQLKIASQG